MNRFTTGIMAGGVMTALGVAYAMADRKTKHKLVKRGKQMAGKAEHAMENLMDDMM